MLSGYNDFEKDVRGVFLDVIIRHGFHTVLAQLDAVALENAQVELAFSIMEEDMAMSVKSAGEYYEVTDIARLADPTFFNNWEAERQAACNGLYREAYYQRYLQFYKILADKFLESTYATGIIPMQEANTQFAKQKQTYNENYSRAWKAMQQLPAEHPIRQKYTFDDPSWVDEMIALLDQPPENIARNTG